MRARTLHDTDTNRKQKHTLHQNTNKPPRGATAFSRTAAVRAKYLRCIDGSPERRLHSRSLALDGQCCPPVRVILAGGDRHVSRARGLGGALLERGDVEGGNKKTIPLRVSLCRLVCTFKTVQSPVQFIAHFINQKSRTSKTTRERAKHVLPPKSQNNQGHG